MQCSWREAARRGGNAAPEALCVRYIEATGERHSEVLGVHTKLRATQVAAKSNDKQEGGLVRASERKMRAYDIGTN